MRTLAAFLLSAAVVAAQDAPKSEATAAPKPTEAPKVPPIEKLKLPAGFKVSVFAHPVPNARSLVLSPKGTLFVGSRNARKVYAIRDTNGDGAAESIVTVASGLNSPNGVAVKDGALYVGEKTRIIRYDGIEDALEKPPAPVVVSEGHPDGMQHGHKHMRFGPDGWLYFGSGAPCNICDHEKDEPRNAAILRLSPDSKTLEIFASGVRNTVGFDWHPQTKELWFTDNGRDWLTEGYNNIPADELNHAPKKGMHFGYPFCHQGDIPNPSGEAATGRDEAVNAPEDVCGKYTPPAVKLDPHVAALGMKFYTGEMFPAEYRGAIFIAEHGSWNRSPEAGHTGHRVVIARPDKEGAARYEPFMTGFLENNTAWGRPVDVLLMPDGSMLVSDDKAGAIYRITYSK
jgi:glucose/arabinose dehydrogenase